MITHHLEVERPLNVTNVIRHCFLSDEIKNYIADNGLKSQFDYYFKMGNYYSFLYLDNNIRIDSE